MRELSLFTGAGGGLLGTHLLGWTPVGYVENDEYCQRIISARIADGILPAAPLFGDIRAFIRDGYADAYQGMVDAITAGFPCQPFSIAGRRAGSADDRNLWPETIDTIRRVRPGLVYLENVPALLTHPYADTIFGDLAESGYDCRWRRLSAAEVGAPHIRHRWWCIAYARGASLRHESEPNTGRGSAAESRDHGPERAMADADSTGRTQQRGCESVRTQSGSIECPGWWSTEPELGRVADGVANRVDRLRSLGNGQIPEVVRTAWQLLTGDDDG